MSSEQKKFCCGVCQLNYELANGIVFGEKPKQAPITLTLTREQAEALLKGVEEIRWCCRSKPVTELKKQIEEKLK